MQRFQLLFLSYQFRFYRQIYAPCNSLRLLQLIKFLIDYKVPYLSSINYISGISCKTFSQELKWTKGRRKSLHFISFRVFYPCASEVNNCQLESDCFSILELRFLELIHNIFRCQTFSNAF